MLLNNDNGVFIFAQFTGHIYDTVLDIYFAEARFYDAKGRQWLNSDPMKDGLNWYLYVGANPATFFDPSGLFMRTKDTETKKYILSEYRQYMNEEDIALLKREGTIHFSEAQISAIGSNFRSTQLYIDSIDESNNYIYQKSPRSSAKTLMTPNLYQYDRESRLFFLKHYARVQANKHIYQNRHYFPKFLTCDPITDAQAYKNMAQYAVTLNSAIIDDATLNGQVLDDLILTIGSSQYSVSKRTHPDEFTKSGASIYQLGLLTFGQTGFSTDLQETFENDPSPNNIQHNLLAIYIGYHYDNLAYIPSALHELFPNKGVPGTWEDWESSKRGISLGKSIQQETWVTYYDELGNKYTYKTSKGSIDMRDLPDKIYEMITYKK